MDLRRRPRHDRPFRHCAINCTRAGKPRARIRHASPHFLPLPESRSRGAGRHPSAVEGARENAVDTLRRRSRNEIELSRASEQPTTLGRRRLRPRQRSSAARRPNRGFACASSRPSLKVTVDARQQDTHVRMIFTPPAPQRPGLSRRLDDAARRGTRAGDVVAG